MESPLPAATRARYPPWVLLDTNAYFDEGVNSTTAHVYTRAGDTIRVTFYLAPPPFVSHFCLPANPDYYCSAPTGAQVISSAKDLVLLRFAFPGNHYEYFLYQAAGSNPSSLRSIPPIHPGVSNHCILPCDNGDGEFLVVDLSNALKPGRFLLDVFSSQTNKWVTRPLQLQAVREGMPRQPYKVVALGGAAVGWIDLWRGILVCGDVLDDDPALRFVPLPRPGFGFDQRKGTGLGHPQQVRDVAFCDDGFIKLVEMDCRFKEVLVNGDAKNSNVKTTYDLDTEDTIHDSELLPRKRESSVPAEECALVPDGWKIRTCYRHISWDYWRKGHVVDADDIIVCNQEHCKVLPQLWDHNAGKSALRNLAVSYPTLNTRGDDIVYFMAKGNINDRCAWMVGIDLGKKTVEIVDNVADYFQPPFLPCSFSKYLNTTHAL